MIVKVIINLIINFIFLMNIPFIYEINIIEYNLYFLNYLQLKKILMKTK